MKEKRKKNKQLECLKKYREPKPKEGNNKEILNYVKNCMLNLGKR